MSLSLSLFTKMPRCLCRRYLSRLSAKAPLAVMLTVGLFGCSSIKTPEMLKNLSLPNVDIPANDPSFRKRLYAGGSFGTSILKPDTRNTVYTTAGSSSTASDFRLGIDLHNKLSVEMNTSLLGKIDFAQSNEFVTPDMSYASASISALVYGLTGVKNRSRRIGFSGYGRIGYGLVQHGSIVEPFDYRDNSILVGLGAEYGFNNGLALRAEVTRVDDEATFMGLGGIYRFGMTPKNIGQVFVDASKPVLGAANIRTEVRNGKVYRINGGVDEQSTAPMPQSLTQNQSAWAPKVSKHDLDGDGVANRSDKCAGTAANITVGSNGCGMFDSVLTDVTFKRGSSWLTPKARGALDDLAETLLAFPEARIQVQAHTDSDGPAEVNLGLSARRAESVVAYLTEKGIAERQLETLGLGETQPLDTNETEASKKRNRRVELVTLANIDQSHFVAQVDSGVPMLGAANPADSMAKDPSKAVASAVAFVAQEPVFPPMSGVKIEPLPNPVFVPGVSLGGILYGVGFQDDSATLTDDATSRLQTVSHELKAFPTVKLVVMGHTDNQQPEQQSLALSQQRARSVVQYLVSAGIDAGRLQAKGFGSSLPLAQNVTESDRKRNRRIEIRVIQ